MTAPMQLPTGTYFVTGIDTDIGKTIATGYIARQLHDAGCRVITQKLIQTGCQSQADDIITHRAMMGVPLLVEDSERLTMPMVLSYPASPHLASQIDGVAVDLDAIRHSTQVLSSRYDVVLVEGAGGLMVPLLDRMADSDGDDGLVIDYIAKQGYPVILVTSGRLGSINHTLLSLQALARYGLTVFAVAYNLNDDSQDTIIADDTKRYLQAYLAKHHPQAKWWQIPVFNN